MKNSENPEPSIQEESGGAIGKKVVAIYLALIVFATIGGYLMAKFE